MNLRRKREGEDADRRREGNSPGAGAYEISWDATDITFGPAIGGTVSPPAESKPPAERKPSRTVEGPLVGWRAWNVNLEEYPPKLGSTFHEGAWEAVEHAECVKPRLSLFVSMVPPARPKPEHPAPMPGCTCGIYSYTGSHPSVNLNTQVLGLAIGWGLTVLHEKGWRAEHARALALIRAEYPPGLGIDKLMKRYNAKVEYVAGFYGVPVLSFPQAKAYVSEWIERP